MDTSWLKQEVADAEEELIALRRDFHAHPELGTKEVRTSKKVEEYLNNLGIETKRVINTGVVGLLNGAKPGKCLLLRADMDALPLCEETGLPFASKNPGVMHACGHDCHTAMLLVAAKILSKHRDEFPGCIKFVFQPNEEEDGAEHLVKEGVLENPRPDAALATHVWTPIKSGFVGLSEGPVMAEMYNFTIELKGRAAHSSDPSKGIDAILCAAQIVQSLQMIQSRELHPQDATCLCIGEIKGGTKSNIIADSVTMKGSLRYIYDGDDEGPQQPRARVKRIVHGIAEACRVEATVDFEVSNYVLINDGSLVDFVKKSVVSEIVPTEKIVEYACMAGEDFSAYSSHSGIPGVFMFIGAGNEKKGTHYPHHTVNFDIDEDVLSTGVEFFVKSSMEYLNQ